jgi:hypothetical protein
MAGARYWSQFVSTWKNLSSPASVGATTNPTCKIR